MVNMEEFWRRSWYCPLVCDRCAILGSQVARCTKIINPGTDEAKYVINVKQIAKVRSVMDF